MTWHRAGRRANLPGVPELIAPTIELYASWLAAREEWGPGTHQDGSGLRPADYVDTAAGFAAWVDRLHRQGDESLPAGGHIGYGVRPSARGRGVATWALGAVLPLAAARGLDRVLVTCADGNAASARVIERHGGVLEDVRDTELGRTRRYWITLSDQPAASGPVR